MGFMAGFHEPLLLLNDVIRLSHVHMCEPLSPMCHVMLNDMCHLCAHMNHYAFSS